ncbi:WYL domain-containing protein [Paracoccus aminovorans]
MTFSYKNWRGESATRRVRPLRMWFGSTEWHSEPQWFLEALDIDKNQVRDFALVDISFS